ncbi:MAG: cupin domain-containing protein [Pseudomonadota bacterium]
MTESFDVGAQLRALRVAHGLSQRELAKRAHVTNGMISLIEQNRVSPSVGSLMKVLDGIPTTIAEFFAAAPAPAPSVRYSASELTAVSVGAVELRLVASRRPQRAMCILHERYAPGGDTGPDRLAHPGEKGGVVVKGCVELTVGSEVTVLRPGDGYYFSTAVPYRMRNVGDEDCEIISASTPPNY